MTCPIQNPVFAQGLYTERVKDWVNFWMLPVIVYRRKYITVVNQFYKTSSRMPVSCDAINVLFIIHDKKRLMFTVTTLGGLMSTQDYLTSHLIRFQSKVQDPLSGSKASLFIATGDLSTAVYQQGDLKDNDTTPKERLSEHIAIMVMSSVCCKNMMLQRTLFWREWHCRKKTQICMTSQSLRFGWGGSMPNCCMICNGTMKSMILLKIFHYGWNLVCGWPIQNIVRYRRRKASTSRTHPECRLYQAAMLRAHAQLHLYNGNPLPEDLLSDLRRLHHSWSDLDFSEIWKRIPYWNIRVG